MKTQKRDTKKKTSTENDLLSECILLSKYIREYMYSEGQVAAFALLTIAKTEKVRNQILAILKKELEPIFSKKFVPDPDNDGGTVLSFKWITLLEILNAKLL
jgi:hypothetical protein